MKNKRDTGAREGVGVAEDRPEVEVVDNQSKRRRTKPTLNSPCSPLSSVVVTATATAKTHKTPHLVE